MTTVMTPPGLPVQVLGIGMQGPAGAAVPLDSDGKLPKINIPRDWSGDPINAMDYGFALDDETDETERLRDLLELQRDTGRPLVLPPGFYAVISDDFVIDWDGLVFEMRPGAMIRQATHGKGFLQLRTGTAYHAITGVRVKYVGARSPLTGRYRGYAEFQRMCAVWSEAEASLIADVQVDNMYNGVCLRGPVVRNPAGEGYTGADDDPVTAYSFADLAAENELRGVRARNSDFAITGHQQSDGIIADWAAWDVTKTISNTPPHAIYMTLPGSAPDGGKLTRMTFFQGRCIRNQYGAGHKILDFEDCTFDQIFSVSTPGGLHLRYGTGRVGLVSLQDQIQGSNPDLPEKWGVYAYDVVGQIDSVSVSMHDGAESGLIYCWGSSAGACDLEVNDASVTSRFPAGESTNAAIVRAEGYATIRVNDAYHHCAGADIKEMFVAKDASRVIGTNFRTKGSNKLANAEPAGGGYSGASVHLNYDPLQIDGWSSTTVNTGNSTDAVTEVRQGATKEFNWHTQMTVYGTSSAGSNTYSTRSVRVLRVGNLVWIFGRIVLSGALASTGDLRIGPLPYAAAGTGSDADVSVPLSSWNAITAAAGDQIMASVLDGESFIRLQFFNAGVRTNVTHAAIGSGLRVEFGLCYRTSDPI